MKIISLLLSKIEARTIFLVFVLSPTIVFAQPTSQTFTSSGTYVVPATWGAIVKIEAWGGGGGGNGGGGGGGAYASITDYKLTAGSYVITVGAGGAFGTTTTAPTKGGNSSFTAIVIAAGGSGASGTTGAAGAGGTAAASTGTTKWSGGNGGIMGAAIGGGGGGSATASAVGGNGSNTGTGGTGTGGAGTTNVAGGNGNVPGGGGGGAFANGITGGNGAVGRVIVTVLIPLPVTFGKIEATKKNNILSVNWVTESETNNAYFDIEASKDGTNFKKIGTATTKALNGNSSTELQYSFSINYSQAVGLLGIAMLILSIPGFSYFQRRKKLSITIILLFAIAFVYSSCSKSTNSEGLDYKGKVFIRIAQTDKEGTKAYSKIVQVINE
jgi:hypothetical protein